MKSAGSSTVVMLIATAMLTFTSATGAVDALPSGKGINVMTLYMQRMSTLEQALHKAVNSRDSAALDRMLSPFFEIRRPGNMVVQRDAWLREGVKSDGQLHDLAAYEVQNSVVANFTLAAPGLPDRFIVDVWTHEKNEWRLRVRFESTIAH